MKWLWVVISTFLVALALTSTVVLIQDDYKQEAITAKASSTGVFLCLNNPPLISSNCSMGWNQSTRLEDWTQNCHMAASDADNDSFNFSINVSTIPSGVWARLGDSDNLIINASQEAVGARTIQFYAQDTSECVNGWDNYYYNFIVHDINDPPDYFAQLEDVTFPRGESESPFTLDSYFRDVDGDDLNYSVSGANIVSVSIYPETSIVKMFSSGCGIEYLVFRATDPGNLSADSHIIEVEVTCSDDTGNDDGSSSGSGGGGQTFPPCVSEWVCQAWTECFTNGTRMKRCVDMNGCDSNYERQFWENCTYNPSCHDGVQNGDETGVDCGGSCKPCGTCFDGIRNQDEEAIDCGGSYCDACYNCTDGIQNWGELGVDCGGPYCDACPSCFDGVQNGNETGIDCGGECGPCIVPEIPAPVDEEENNLLQWLLIALGALVVLVIAYKLLHKQVAELFASIGWYFTKKHRKQIFLEDEQKKHFLKEVHRLEQKIHVGKPIEIIDELTSLVREFLSAMYDLPFAFEETDIRQAIVNKTNHKAMQEVMTSFFTKHLLYEQHEPHLSKLELSLFNEEFRQLIFQTSAVHKDDLFTEIEELSLAGSHFEQAHITLFNAHLALQFEEIGAAKKHYMKLLDLYEKIQEKQKTQISPDIQRLYQEIRYILSYQAYEKQVRPE